MLLDAREQEVWREFYLFIIDRYEDINAQTIRIAADMADVMTKEYMDRAKCE